MKRTTRDLEQGTGARLSAGSGGGRPASSSLLGSQWAKGPRPTERPMSKMELRAKHRAALQGQSEGQEAVREVLGEKADARAARKEKFGIKFAKGGLVKSKGKRKKYI